MSEERYILPIQVQLFLRPQGDKKVMILGICDEGLLSELPEKGEMVVGYVQIFPDARLDPGERFRGLRADQILTSYAALADMRKKDKGEP